MYKNKKKIFLKLTVLFCFLVFVIPAFAAEQAQESSEGGFLVRFIGMFQTTLVYAVFYALMALGFALIFGAARVVNLYHGSFYMLGAYIFATFAKTSQFSFPTFGFIIIQIIIVAGLVMFIIRSIKNKSAKKQPVYKKFAFPVLLVVFAQLPLLMLYFKISFPGFGNIDLLISLILTMGIIGSISVAINKYLIEPVRGEGVTVLIITIALAFFTERLISAIYGSSSIPVPSFISTYPVSLIAGSTLDSKRLFMFIIGVVLIILVWLIMNKTKLGKGVLAVAQDKEAATLMGINPKFVYAFAIALSGILAAFAGIFSTPFLGDAAPNIWMPPLIKAFAIVILGGMGSIFGSVIAAFILAFVEKFTKYFISSSLEEVVFLIVIIIILVIRPQGLFGKKGRV